MRVALETAIGGVDATNGHSFHTSAADRAFEEIDLRRLIFVVVIIARVHRRRGFGCFEVFDRAADFAGVDDQLPGTGSARGKNFDQGRAIVELADAEDSHGVGRGLGIGGKEVGGRRSEHE